MGTDTTTAPCDCCEGLAGPAPVYNAPGLSSLAYRVDTQPGFYARMLQSLPLARSDSAAADAPRPLARLLTREGDDATVAFTDAAACVADVLTFYQERIANEGYLRTATERRSVLELARAIGYELKPGVAANAQLAFAVEDAPGAPGVCTLAQGSPVQSVPPQGKPPQVFETGADIVARAEWNALVPRRLRPADLALLPDPGADSPAAGSPPAQRHLLVLLGPEGSFVAATPGLLHSGLASAALCRLDPNLPVDAKVDAIEVGRIDVTEAAGTINGGDLLLFVAKNGAGETRTLVLRALDVVAEPAHKRIRIGVEPLPEPHALTPAPRPDPVLRYRLVTRLNFASVQVAPVRFTRSEIANTVVSKVWRESELQAMIGIQGWSAPALQAVASAPPAVALAPKGGAFAFGARLGFFGSNAPRWGSLPVGGNVLHNDPYPEPWDADEGKPGGPGPLPLPRTVWETSQGEPPAGGSGTALAERAVPNVTRESWVVFDAPEAAAQPYTVLDAREVSAADFGVSGRAMQLRLADAQGRPLASQPPEPTFHFRTASAHVASRALVLADLPIDEPIAAGDTEVELDRMVLGLAAGQLVALSGENADLPQVSAAEIAVLADIVHAEGRSTLHFERALTYSYVRASLILNANVVAATHGETVNEILGNGDASLPNQQFVLKRPPTTYTSATGGVASSLQVRVAGVLWHEVASLYGAAPDAPVYTTRLADDARMTLTFGDGVQGARLPTGSMNVSARYRSGIGPDGEVAAGTLTILRAMPLGLRGVGNPVAASGAEGPERLADARRNAPLTLLTFERVVSLLDYENYARAFPGIGKARGDLLWVDGEQRIFLTLAGATGGLPDATVLANLVSSIGAASDPAQRFAAAAYVQRYFKLEAKVAVDARYIAADVLAAVSAALMAGFGFDARDLGQSVTAAEVVARMHTVAGVVAVELDVLLPYIDAPPPANPVLAAVPAFGARRDLAGTASLPAELLLINPGGVVLSEMAQ